MKNFSLNAKIIFVLSIFIVAAVSISALGISRMNKLNDAIGQVISGDAKRLEIALRIRGRFANQVINEKNFIMTPDVKKMEDFAREIKDGEEKFFKLLDDYETLAATEAAKASIEKMRDLYKQWAVSNKKIQELSLQDKNKEAGELSMGVQREIRTTLNEEIDTLVERNQNFMKEKDESTTREYQEARNLMLIISAVSILVGMVLAFFILRAVSRAIDQVIANLTDNSCQVTSAAQQIAASSEQLSQASTEQASSLEETAASIEEMSSMVQKNSENAKKSAEISGVSQTSAEKGKQVVRDMIDAIDGINSSNNSIMAQINESNQQIAEIVQVIAEIGNKTKVINDIVFQTKLLSFNASVEAARAGEHGKGFAVVAEEVGNLAQMSGNAAKEITGKLDSSIQKVEGIVNDTKTKVGQLVAQGKEKVEAGTQVAQQCGHVLDEIVQNVSTVSQMVAEIATACQEQAQGVQEITKAMGQMDQMTQQNAATSEEAASAAEELSAQAEALGGVVQVLVDTVKGQNGNSAPMGAAPKAAPAAARQRESAPVVKLNRKALGKPAPLKLAAGAESSVPSEQDPRFKDV